MLYEIQEMINDAAKAIGEKIIKDCKPVTDYSKIGLDVRANVATMYVCDDYMATNTLSLGRLNYYGGFEYIEKEFIETIGEWTIYSGDDNRVRECIDAYFGRETKNEDDSDV